MRLNLLIAAFDDGADHFELFLCIKAMFCVCGNNKSLSQTEFEYLIMYDNLGCTVNYLDNLIKPVYRPIKHREIFQ